jgi:hypothetical protein
MTMMTMMVVVVMMLVMIMTMNKRRVQDIRRARRFELQHATLLMTITRISTTRLCQF